jgi:hypothetical protein
LKIRSKRREKALNEISGFIGGKDVTVVLLGNNAMCNCVYRARKYKDITGQGMGKSNKKIGRRRNI